MYRLINTNAYATSIGQRLSKHQETYPQYRRKLFLEFLVEVADRMPTQMGAMIWDRYHELSSTALPAYQNQMTLLKYLKAERHQDEKEPIELWQAKLGFVIKKYARI